MHRCLMPDLAAYLAAGERRVMAFHCVNSGGHRVDFSDVRPAVY